MTVVRQDRRTFESPQETIAEAVRKILSRGHQRYLYTEIHESPEGSSFTATIRPVSRLLLSTPMRVHLESEGSRTTVSVETRSQFFILGDVFDMYRQYIRDFLYALEDRLQRDA